MSYPHRPPLRGNRVDGVAGVGLAARGVGVEPGVELLAGDLPHQHHRIRHRPVRPAWVCHAVQRDGRLVHVALRVDSNRVNELLVLRHALRRLQVFVKKGPYRIEVDVENAVGLGQ
jgi:hypothetical protein